MQVYSVCMRCADWYIDTYPLATCIYMSNILNGHVFSFLTYVWALGWRYGVRSEEITVPKKSILYKYRIDLDLASMLWARQHVFDQESSWFIHCRLDASLQYGKDYFMSECDVFRPGDSIRTWADVGKPGVLVTQLLVGQTLGARASGVIVKTQKLLHQLALDPMVSTEQQFCLLSLLRTTCLLTFTPCYLYPMLS